MSPDPNEALYKRLAEEEYAKINKIIDLEEGSVITEMTILRLVARAAATMDFIFMYIARYFDAVQESKQPNGFQVGEGNNDFQAPTSGL